MIKRFYFDTYALIEIGKGNPKYEPYKEDVMIILSKLNLLEFSYYLFKEQKENVGHLFLRKMEKALFPSWKKYLKNKAKNIAQFYNEINANLEIKKILEQLSEDLNTD